MVGTDCSDSENDLIVADYFAMLRAELTGQSYNKSAHRRALLPGLAGRSPGAVEFKHQNISAVLVSLGETHVLGYKPLFNFQEPLEYAVVRWLNAHPEWLSRTAPQAAGSTMQDASPLWVAPPPTLRNRPPPDELRQMQRIAVKFDVAERDARNRALGRAGEERVLRHEIETLRRQGRADLASKVRWVSEQDGDGAGYDISSFFPDGRRRLLEVKTTNGGEWTPFHLSRNELAVSDEERAEWCLFRLWDFSREAKAFELHPPLDAHVNLIPTAFQARFR